MNTNPALRHWMHYLHDESGKFMHFTEHMLHEKAFWGVLAIVTLMVLAALFAMLIHTDNHSPLLMPTYQYYGWRG